MSEHPDSTTVLDLQNVSMTFGGLHAVQDISLTVARGQRWAVIGPNGAGKTTLFKCVAGEYHPTAGRVMLFGRDATRRPPNKRAHDGLARTYQVTNVFLDLTVEENITIAAQAVRPGRLRVWWPVRLKGELADKVEDALGQTDLVRQRHAPAGELSHGEQRQLELALALASAPRLLLLDEPAAGLSASERVLMRKLINNLPKELSVVLIEHDMSLALELVEQVMCMDNGTMVAKGTPDEIRANERVQAVYLKSD